MEGSVDRDAGAMLRDGIKCMEKLGVCPEATWKYLGFWISENSMSLGKWHNGLNGTRFTLLVEMFERWQALSDVERATYMDRVRSAQLWWLAFHG